MNRRVLELFALTPLLLHASASSGLRGAKRSKTAAMDGVLTLSEEEEEGARVGGRRMLVGQEERGRDTAAPGQNLDAGLIFSGSVLETSQQQCREPGVEMDPVRLCCHVWSSRGLGVWPCVSARSPHRGWCVGPGRGRVGGGCVGFFWCVRQL